MSQFTSLFILLDLLAIVSVLIGLLTTAAILFIIIYKFDHRHTIANLLLANTCICTIEVCVCDLVIYGFIIANDVTPTVSRTSLYDQENLCPIRSYFLFVGFSLLYTSYCLQAYYRFRQVLFYRTAHNYKIYVCLCVIQWIFSFLVVLPMLFTKSFVYIPTEFFCPIPFTKPLSVAYVAVCVYGVFLTIFGAIYFRIYIYITRTTAITIQRRRTNDRQFIMVKRMILPTFSLISLGIVYLILFFQAIANQYQVHFLTYRLSYLFIAIGMSFIHIITILQAPQIRKAVLEIFYCFRQQMWRQEENVNTVTDIPNTTIQQRQQRIEQQTLTSRLQRNKVGPTVETLTKTVLHSERI